MFKGGNKRRGQSLKKIRCSKCEFSTNLSNDLNAHMEIHLKEDQEIVSLYECDKCEFTTDSKNKLRKHKRTKHELNVFQCPICDYKAISTEDLNYHEKVSHTLTRMDRLINCDKCNY